METTLPLLIGKRVGDRRAALSLSLDDVASRTGVSRAMVSRIERGEVHASAVVLDRLCAGLGISLSTLFARDTAAPLLRHGDQQVWRDPQSGYLRREVAPAGTGSPTRIVEIDFPAGGEVVFRPGGRRPAEQHVWVLEGEIDVALGAITYALKPGDCLHMRVSEVTSFRNTSGRRARYAVILTTMEPLP